MRLLLLIVIVMQCFQLHVSGQIVITPEERKRQDQEFTAGTIESLKQQSFEQRIKHNLNMLTAVRLIADKKLKNSKFTESLGFTDEQLETINKAYDEFDEQYRDAANQPFDADRYSSPETQLKIIRSKLEEALRKTVGDSLLYHQFEFLSNMDVAKVGLPKLVTRSAVAELIELTDGQRARIESQSQALAENIRKMMEESRQKTYDIVFNELDEDQKKKLFKLYDKEKLKLLVGRSQMMRLYSHLVYELPESFDKRESPAILVFFTEIRDDDNE